MAETKGREEQRWLSDELRAFYERHNIKGIDEFLTNSIDRCPRHRRYIRLNPGFDQLNCLSLLEEETGETPVPVSWLGSSLGFYSLPGDFKLAESASYRSGRVYGMDASSGAAVACLLSQEHDISKGKLEDPNNLEEVYRVLDLCCAPGLKLCLVADLLPKATVVGVDVSSQRLAVCRSIIKKYQIAPETAGTNNSKARIRLYCTDGVSFGQHNPGDDLVFDSTVARDEASMSGERKRMNKSAKARERRKLKAMSAIDKTTSNENLDETRVKRFDLVLVDAECSTDGSIKHVEQQLRKRTNSDKAVDNETLTNAEKLKELLALQRGLIKSGYRLLRSGGLLVYSTCSLSTSQNEDVVQWLLDEEPSAQLVPVHFHTDFSVPGSIPGTVKFVPQLEADNFFSGGFFLAKLQKQSNSA